MIKLLIWYMNKTFTIRAVVSVMSETHEPHGFSVCLELNIK